MPSFPLRALVLLPFAAVSAYAGTPPVVSITSPAAAQAFLAPGSVQLTATATSSGSTIASVTYFLDGTTTKIAVVTAGPTYAHTWKLTAATPAGSHVLTAVAKDKTGASTTSAPVAITINQDVAPTVTLTSPADGYTALGPSSVVLSASAYSTDSTIATVAFYEDGSNKVSTGKVTPYTFTLKGVTPGNHTFYAVATDVLGVSGQSTPVSVTINPDVPPTVSITSPAGGSTFPVNAAIALSALAASTDEAVTSVEFASGAAPPYTRIATTKAPFAYSWKKAAVGSYSLVAIATDSLGVTSTSSPVSISVVADQTPSISLVSPISGATYATPASIELLATASSPDAAVSSVTYFYGGNNKIATVSKAPYAFDWKPTVAGSYTVTATVTDSVGATATSAPAGVTVTPAATSTVKITAPTNGKAQAAPANLTIVATATVPSGDSVSSVAFYASGNLLGTATSSPYQFNWQNIPAGVYYLTAVATDAQGNALTSAPITFTSDAPPVVAVSTPNSQSTFAAPAAIVFTAAVADSGKITKVVFTQGSSTIGTATAAPYQVSWGNVGVGTYSVTATAYDSLGITGTSAPLVVQVISDAGPVVSLATPSSALTFGSSDNVTLSYTVTDASAPVTSVEVFRNGALAGTLTAPSSGSTWTFSESAPLPIGSYSYYAQAFDSAGVSTDSALATVLVAPSLPYQTNFEAGEGLGYFNLGALAGQGGWTNPQGTANISGASFSGSQTLQLAAGSPVSQAQLAFAPATGETVEYCDFNAEPVAEASIAASSLFVAEQAEFGFQQSNGQAVLQVFQGNGLGGGTWAPTSFSAPIGANNQVQGWVRLTARLDFTRHTWDLYANGALVAYDVPFISNASSSFSSFQAQGDANTDTFVDLLSVSAANPLFADVNNDGINDVWETQYGLSLSVDDRSLNISGDGVPIIQDYLTGADPLINTKVVPDPIQSGLLLHLRADAGVVADSSGNVSEWLDQSPNGNIATLSQPGLQPVLTANQSGGAPALAFGSTNGAPTLSLPYNLMQNASAGEIVALVRIGSNPNQFNNLWAFGEGFGSSYINTVHYEDFGTPDLNSVVENPAEVAQYYIYDTSISSDGTSVYRYNGNPRWIRTNLPVQFNQYPTLGGLVGDIAEVMVYNRVLTDAERTTLNTYLQGKYSLPAIATPAAPSDVTATPLSSHAIDVFWTAQNSLMHTVTTVQRQLNGGAFATIGQVNDAASYTDTGLTAGATYGYQVTIQSYAGTSGASNTATATTPANQADLPTQGMALWLRTTAGTLGTGGLFSWTDQSGLGNNASSFDQVSVPLVVGGQANGLPVVRFGGQNSLALPAGMLQSAQAGQIIAVVRISNLAGGGGNSLWGFGTGSETTYFDATLLDDFGSNDTTGFQETEGQITQYFVFDSSIDASGNAVHRNDGVAEWLRPPNASVQYGFQQFPAIGGYPPGNLFGDIAEVIVYSRVLSSDEQNTVYAYLASKYSLAGITANLNAPVVTSPPSATGATGQSFSYQLQATSSTTTSYQASGLPKGLGISSSGLISGVPVSDGTSTVTVTATNASGTSSFTLTIMINPSAPVITSPLADTGQEKVPYGYTITASEGATQFSASGLPSGVSLQDPSSGIISGTPTSSGTFNVVLTATNAAGTGTATLVLTIGPSPPSLTSPTNSPGTVSTPFTYTPSADQSGVTYSAAGLPPFLSIDPNTGVISGTPTAGGTFAIVLTLTDANGSSNANLTLSFSPNFPVTNGMLLWLRADQGVVTDSSGNVSQWNDQSALGNYAFQASAANQPSLAASSVNGLPAVHFNGPNSLNLQTNMMQGAGAGQIIAVVRIGSNPDAFNTLWVFGKSGIGTSYFNTSHYDDFGNNDAAPVDVETSGQISQFYVYDTSIDASGLDVFRSDGIGLWSRQESQASLAFSAQPNIGGPGTGSLFGDIAEIFVFGRVLSASEQAQVYSYLATKYGMAGITSALGSPAITSGGGASGQVDQAFSFQVSANNAPTSFAASGLPDGLRIDPPTGAIFGTPTKPGTFAASVFASNASGTGSSPVIFQISGAPPSITSAPTASGQVGQTFTFQVVATNNPTAYTAAGLPSDYNFDPTLGLITGNPSAPGSFSVSLTASNAAGTGTQTLVITIASGPPGGPTITSASTASAQVGEAFSFQVTATGNPFGYAASPLPSWLQLNSLTGLLTGAPTVPGATNIVISATNGSGTTFQTLTITVESAGAPIGPVASGLTLWLEGDSPIETQTLNGTATAVWPDQSGQGHDATQSSVFNGAIQAPSQTPSALNKHAVMHFTPSKRQFLEVGNLSFPNAGEMFVVMQEPSAATMPTPESNIPAAWSFSNGTFVNDTVGWIDDFLAQNQVTAVAHLSYASYNLFDATSSTTSWAARLNGQVLTAGTGNNFLSAGALAIGNGTFVTDPDGDIFYGATTFDGDIAEILIYNRVLSDPERLAVGQYLTAKYALPNIPAPPAPTGLAAQAIAGNEVYLSWSEASVGYGVTYTIQRQTSGGGFVQVGQVQDQLNFVDSSASPGTAYVYQIVASDYNPSAGGLSNTASVTTPMISVSIPASGLQLWLRADIGTAGPGSTVQAWGDQSGQNNLAQQTVPGNAPTLLSNAQNSLPAVHFQSSASQFLALPNVLGSSTSGEAIVVIRTEVKGTSSAYTFGSFGTDFYGPSAPDALQVGTTGVSDGFLSGTSNFAVIGNITNFNIYGVSAATGQWINWINGNYLSGGTIGSESSSLNIPTPITSTGMLGSDGVLKSLPLHLTYFDGDIAEVIVYNRNLTDNERLAIGQYLQAKYNLSGPISPATPAGVTAHVDPFADVVVNWPAIPGATSYSIVRSVDGAPYVAVAVVGADSPSPQFIDFNAPLATTLQYEVQAISYSGQSAFSAAASSPSPDAIDPATLLPYWLESDLGMNGLPAPPTQPPTPPAGPPGTSPPVITLTIPPNATLQ